MDNLTHCNMGNLPIPKLQYGHPNPISNPNTNHNPNHNSKTTKSHLYLMKCTTHLQHGSLSMWQPVGSTDSLQATHALPSAAL